MIDEVSIVDIRDVKDDTTDIPNCPGIYAWYKKIELDDTSKVDFDKSINSILKKEWKGDITVVTDLKGYELEIKLRESKKEITDSKKNIANAVGSNGNIRAKFCYLSTYASVMQEPLYVGKGDDLEVRISSHINGNTDFSKRIYNAGFKPTDCILLYLELKSLPNKSNKLLEYIVDSLSSPYYGEQSG